MAVRKFYDSVIEDRMRKNAKEVTGGNPSYLSYWKKVKILDRFFDGFSSESLRAHWILMGKKDSLKIGGSHLNDENQERARISSFSPDQKSNIGINSITPQPDNRKSALWEEKKVEGLSENRCGCTSPIYSKISYKIDTCSTLKKKNTTSDTPTLEKIDEIFDNLVDICSVVAKKRLNEIEVIQVLLLKKGRLQEVVNFFKTNH